MGFKVVTTEARPRIEYQKIIKSCLKPQLRNGAGYLKGHAFY